jgi:ABC-type dipeptide/oligopeptide/nickel transport system permease component
VLRYLLRRLILAVLVCATVLVVAFALTRLSGDVAVAIAGPQATPADIATIRRENGLDRPLTEQFLSWAGSAATGDFGRSFLYRAPVGQLIWARLPITLTLGCAGLAIALLVSIPLGMLAATVEGSLLDRALMLIALLGQAVPSFWLGLLLIIWLGLDLGWLPINGLDDWTGYILPSVTLAFSGIPAMMRLTRSGMVDALRADYIRTARAKGLSRLSIVGKHALRNAAMPLVAIAAVQLGFMLGGSIVVESVFNLPGLGYLAWESISKNDFPVVQAVVLILAVIYVALTLLADLLNAVLDPRLRAA